MYTLQSISKFDEFCSKITNQTLVLLDIDDTVITPKSKLFRHGKYCQPDLIDRLKKNNNIPAVSNWRLSRKTILIEPEWVNFINNIKEITTVYALTKVDTGEYGVIPSMEQWRYNELRSHNIIFTEKLLDKNNYKFIINADSNSYAAFYNGIAMTGPFSKVQVLKRIVNKIKNKYNKIIFIDDKKENIMDIKQYCSDSNINFKGFLYTGLDLIKEDADYDTVRKQIDSLVHKNKWLEDEEFNQV